MDWGFWVLFASWVITYGFFVYWAWKYHRLKKKYDEEKFLMLISTGNPISHFNKAGAYRGPKTTLLTDTAIKLEKETLEKLRVESPVLYTNFCLLERDDRKAVNSDSTDEAENEEEL